MRSFNAGFAGLLVTLFVGVVGVVGCAQGASEPRGAPSQPPPSSTVPWLSSDAGHDGVDALFVEDGAMARGAADTAAPPASSPGSSGATTDAEPPPSTSPSSTADAQAPSADAQPPSQAGPVGALQPGVTTVTIQAAGVARTFYLKVPQAVGQGRVPLVIALHGNGDTAQNFVVSNGIDTRADQDGFVLAAPQGMTRDVTVYANGQPWQTIPQIDWDAYDSIQADGSITSANNIDVPLLDAIRTQLVATGSIDTQHVIVYGYSQGGYMAFRYGMSDAADLACAAVLAAADPLAGTMLVEQAARKVPVALQIGTQDDAYAQAQQTVMELQTNGNTVQFSPIQGAGHVPPPGDPLAPLTWCEGQTL